MLIFSRSSYRENTSIHWRFYAKQYRNCPYMDILGFGLSPDSCLEQHYFRVFLVVKRVVILVFGIWHVSCSDITSTFLEGSFKFDPKSRKNSCGQANDGQVNQFLWSVIMWSVKMWNVPLWRGKARFLSVLCPKTNRALVNYVFEQRSLLPAPTRVSIVVSSSIDECVTN